MKKIELEAENKQLRSCLRGLIKSLKKLPKVQVVSGGNGTLTAPEGTWLELKKAIQRCLRVKP